MSYFEIIMIICFGISWPFSIAKTYRTKSVKGKSLVFLVFVLVGYGAGIFHKIWFSLDVVIVFYILNALMVLTDIILYLIYSRREKPGEAVSSRTQFTFFDRPFKKKSE